MFATVLVAAGFALLPSAGAAGAGFEYGDVFLGDDGGNVLWYRADGTLVQTLTTAGASGYVAGLDFDSLGRLYATEWSNHQISRFDSTGTLLGVWASSITQPEDVSIDGDDRAFVGSSGDVRRYSVDGTLQETYATGTRNHVHASATGCTLYSTKGDDAAVHARDLCGSGVETVLLTIPDPVAYQLTTLDGDLFVAGSTGVHRYTTSGTFVQTYPLPENVYSIHAQPGGGSFWAASMTGAVHHVRASDGATLDAWGTGATLHGIALFGAGGGTVTPPVPELTPLVFTAIGLAAITGFAVVRGRRTR